MNPLSVFNLRIHSLRACDLLRPSETLPVLLRGVVGAGECITVFDDETFRCLKNTIFAIKGKGDWDFIIRLVWITKVL